MWHLVRAADSRFFAIVLLLLVVGDYGLLTLIAYNSTTHTPV